MPDLNEIFQPNYEQYCADQTRERPSTEIKVRIRLNQSDIPSQLTDELWNSHNMELSRSNSDRDIVIISGIPPDNGFGEHEVMEEVRKHIPNAEVVSESSQRGGRRG